MELRIGNDGSLKWIFTGESGERRVAHGDALKSRWRSKYAQYKPAAGQLWDASARVIV